ICSYSSLGRLSITCAFLISFSIIVCFNLYLSVPLPIKRKCILGSFLHFFISSHNKSTYCGLPMLPPKRKTHDSSGIPSFFLALNFFDLKLFDSFLVFGNISIFDESNQVF